VNVWASVHEGSGVSSQARVERDLRPAGHMAHGWVSLDRLGQVFHSDVGHMQRM
jgi:hypothetical protein